jgi:hypothetical protein
MMSKAFLLFPVFVGLLLFAVGLLVGQQIQRSKFEKYLQSTAVTSMQLKLMQANLNVIRASVPVSESGMDVPRVDYEPSCRCFEAQATLVRDDLMKRPLDGVRLALMLPAVLTRYQLKAEFPEIADAIPGAPDPDFRMTFRQLDKDSASLKVVAEFVDGRLTFK